MSLLPAFQIGLLNAWLLMVYYPLHPILALLIDKFVGRGAIFRKLGGSPNEAGSRPPSILGSVLIYLLALYSLFLPLKLHSGWLYVGLAVYAVGLAMFLIALLNVAVAPHGEPFVAGIYRYSRHPLYFFSFVTFVGTGIAAASWLFLLLSAMVMVLFAYYARAEEGDCLEQFGDGYREYMRRTPRWLGFPRAVSAR